MAVGVCVTEQLPGVSCPGDRNSDSRLMFTNPAPRLALTLLTCPARLRVLLTATVPAFQPPFAAALCRSSAVNLRPLDNGRIVHVFEAHFRPSPGQGGAASLVYSVARDVTQTRVTRCTP